MKTLATSATSASHIGKAAARSSAAAEGATGRTPWRSRVRSRQGRPRPDDAGFNELDGFQMGLERRGLSALDEEAAAGEQGLRSELLRSGCDVVAGLRGGNSLRRVLTASTVRSG